MKVTVAAIKPARTAAKSAPAEALATEYLARASRYLPCTAETFPSEAALFASIERQAGRTKPCLIVLDPRGKALTSEGFASHLAGLRDSGAQSVILAIGPADGWSAEARTRASFVLSLGLLTLPHELARAVLAEQIYRALTILAGHPYHSGH
ncbi:MAG: 23S rRNA (pseudouridine(1915)-N(3))-methyltransferase RlmH [Acidobacteriaceae bacterium]